MPDRGRACFPSEFTGRVFRVSSYRVQKHEAGPEKPMPDRGRTSFPSEFAGRVFRVSSAYMNIPEVNSDGDAKTGVGFDS